MKSDTDYIRAGVGIVPGWSVGKAKSGNTEWRAPKDSAFMVQVGGAVSSEFKAALAAALVEMVDELPDGYEVRTQSCATTIWYAGKEFWQHGGKGRTMNTIRCCVDFFEANPGLKP